MRSIEARLDNDHLALERWWSHLSSRMAIKAVQIWMRRAFSLVPTKDLTFKFCLSALKNISISQNLPAVFVDGGDGRGAKLLQVGQQFDLALVDGVPHHHTPQQAGTVVLGLYAGEPNQLVGADMPVGRNRCFFQQFVRGIVLQPRD